MEKRITLLTSVLIVVGVSSSVVYALPPMGPPRAILEQDQWDIGVDGSYQEMDVRSWGKVTETQLVGGAPVLTTYGYAQYAIEDLESSMFLAKVGYGLSDNWDIFLRLGAADAEAKIVETQADGGAGSDYSGFDGSHGFAWGLGTRATFWREGDVSWGGLFQITWAEPDESDISDSSDSDFSGTAELDFWEIQAAVGPTWQSDDFRVYGGPFYHYVNGNVDITGQTLNPISGLVMTVDSSGEIREESQFGGYAGAQWHMSKVASLGVEYQFTDDAWGVGISLIFNSK
jgi:hypothetical protein